MWINEIIKRIKKLKSPNEIYSKTLNKTLLSCYVDLILYCEKEKDNRLKQLYLE